ncbi:dephospho-CoA kinase [uncultured Tessaracoccus sp.]|uniref:dephospho-CoA kinase n=1 Tax=uncultured Tessaracoccus sp. TaxID=905023 RepID=UPI0025F260DB|nr:dephospho-CoA kinase [uncultured Tessaracoccus sp.]
MDIALTGGIASGKTTVADLLGQRGAVLIDSDVLAREVVEPGTPGLARIVERFGPGVLADDGALDRAALGRVVFADDAARADLNAIVHPLVRARREELRAATQPGDLVVSVIPLLVETGGEAEFDAVVVVDVPVEQQVSRLMARNGYTRAEAEARVAAQASREERLRVATHVIDNAGTQAATERQVEELVRTLAQQAGECEGVSRDRG